MEINLEFARNQFETTDGNNLKNFKWNELTSALNALGGAHKSSDQWKKYWVDFQSNAKERIAVFQKRQNESGVNGTKKIKELCELDLRIASILTVAALDGDQSTQEGGLNIPTMPLLLSVPTSENDFEVNTTPAEPVASTSHENADSTPPQKKRRTPLKSADKLRSSQSVRAALANVSIKFLLC